jgi:hypothetical protein
VRRGGAACVWCGHTSARPRMQAEGARNDEACMQGAFGWRSMQHGRLCVHAQTEGACSAQPRVAHGGAWKVRGAWRLFCARASLSGQTCTDGSVACCATVCQAAATRHALGHEKDLLLCVRERARRARRRACTHHHATHVRGSGRVSHDTQAKTRVTNTVVGRACRSCQKREFSERRWRVSALVVVRT